MKTLTLIFFVIAACLIATLEAGEFKPSSEALVGEWKGENAACGAEVQIDLRANGSYTMVTDNKDIVKGKWVADFTVKPNRFTLTTGSETVKAIIEFLSENHVRVGYNGEGPRPAAFSQAEETLILKRE